ncbi:MAG: Holliday junction resolvase RuvX [Terrimesophilobacter sp.]
MSDGSDLRPGVRPGVRVGVDVGKVRIGVARCDPHAVLATPVATLKRGDGDIAELGRLAGELGAMEFVVGLPLSLSGEDTASTGDAREFAQRLAAATEISVRLVDERLSTVSAQRVLHTSGRNSRQSRPVVDQVAATIILQHAIDGERALGVPSGTVVAADGTRDAS